MSQTAIRDLSGLGHDQFRKAWATLLRDGHAKEAVSIRKANRLVPAFEANTQDGE